MKQTLTHIQARLPQWELELLLRRAAMAAVADKVSRRLLAGRIHAIFGESLKKRCPVADVDWTRVGKLVARQVEAKAA